MHYNNNTIITVLLAWSTVTTEKDVLAFPCRCGRRNVFLSPTPQEDADTDPHRANIRTCWVNWARAIKKLTLCLRVFEVVLVGSFMILKHTFQAGFSKQKFCHMVFRFHFSPSRFDVYGKKHVLYFFFQSSTLERTRAQRPCALCWEIFCVLRIKTFISS